MQADEVNFGMAIDRLNRRIASKDPRHWVAFKIVAARGASSIRGLYGRSPECTFSRSKGKWGE